MNSYNIDPEGVDQECISALDDEFELHRQTAEYDPQPCLEESEDDDCMD